MPGVMFSALLVFLLTFGELSVPDFLRYDVFPAESFTQFSAFYNFKAATAASVPLAVVTLVLLLVEARFLRERIYYLRPCPESGLLPLIRLGIYRKWLFAVVAAAGFVTVIMPLLVLLIQAGGMDNYVEAVSRAGDSLLRSVLFAVTGATLLSFLGFFIGYLIQTKALRCWRFIDSMTIFLFALPGTVTGIGLISFWNTRWTNLVYATPVIIIIGYIARYTALTSRISIAQFAQLPSSMEEAAQVAGAGWFRRMILIVAPLSRRGLLGGWLVGYIFSLRDIEITMLVYPAGYETLPVRILTLMANGSPQIIAALCMVMIIVTLLPAGTLWILPGLKKEKAVK
jgi:iron(III) transport system permease protein